MGTSPTKASGGEQQVDVVAAHILLRHVNDRHGQTLFTVVVSAVLRDVAGQLSHLDLILEISLEAAEENLYHSKPRGAVGCQ